MIGGYCSTAAYAGQSDGITISTNSNGDSELGEASLYRNEELGIVSNKCRTTIPGYLTKHRAN
jgi:hypothetical protein